MGQAAAPTASAVITQQSMFGEDVMLSRSPAAKVKARGSESEVEPTRVGAPPLPVEANELFTFYKTKFGRMPVDGGGNKRWFFELLLATGEWERNPKLALRMVKCAISRAFELNKLRGDSLRRILENQTAKELLNYDQNGEPIRPDVRRFEQTLTRLEKEAALKNPTGKDWAAEETAAAAAAAAHPYAHLFSEEFPSGDPTEPYRHGIDDNPYDVQDTIDNSRPITPKTVARANKRLARAYMLHKISLERLARGEVLKRHGYFPPEVEEGLPGAPLSWIRAEDIS